MCECKIHPSAVSPAFPRIRTACSCHLGARIVFLYLLETQLDDNNPSQMRIIPYKYFPPGLLKEGHDLQCEPEVQDLFSIPSSFPRLLWEACELEGCKETNLGLEERKQVCYNSGEADVTATGKAVGVQRMLRNQATALSKNSFL